MARSQTPTHPHARTHYLLFLMHLWVTLDILSMTQQGLEHPVAFWGAWTTSCPTKRTMNLTRMSQIHNKNAVCVLPCCCPGRGNSAYLLNPRSFRKTKTQRNIDLLFSFPYAYERDPESPGFWYPIGTVLLSRRIECLRCVLSSTACAQWSLPLHAFIESARLIGCWSTHYKRMPRVAAPEHSSNDRRGARGGARSAGIIHTIPVVTGSGLTEAYGIEDPDPKGLFAAGSILVI